MTKTITRAKDRLLFGLGDFDVYLSPEAWNEIFGPDTNLSPAQAQKRYESILDERLRAEELRQRVRGDRLLEEIVGRYFDFSEATGDPRIGASLTIAWAFLRRGV